MVNLSFRCLTFLTPATAAHGDSIVCAGKVSEIMTLGRPFVISITARIRSSSSGRVVVFLALSPSLTPTLMDVDAIMHSGEQKRTLAGRSLLYFY